MSNYRTVAFAANATPGLTAYYPTCPGDCELNDNQLAQQVAAGQLRGVEHYQEVGPRVRGGCDLEELPVVGWLTQEEVDDDDQSLGDPWSTRIIAAVLLDDSAEVVAADEGTDDEAANGLVEVRSAGSGVDVRRAVQLHLTWHMRTQQRLAEAHRARVARGVGSDVS